MALASALLIGVVGGAVLVSFLQVRPRPPREIRVTVTPNALPHRRAATLAVDHQRSFTTPDVRGGPADAVTLAGTGTHVPSGSGNGGLLAFPIARARPVDLIVVAQPVAIPRQGPVAVADRPSDPPERQRLEGGQADVSAPEASEPKPAGPKGRQAPPPEPAAAAPLTGPCADERRIAAERCALADRLSEQATAANLLLGEQQRTYDELSLRAAQAALIADPREIRAAKETARIAFRRAHASARTREAVETAAGDWLTEINRINQASKDAATDGARAGEAAAQVALAIERLSLDADVARINAESAAEACHLAREVLAACEEAQVDLRAGRVPVDPAAVPIEAVRPKLIGGPELEPSELEEFTAPSERVFSGGQPRMLRMLRGDREAMHAVVEELAGDDNEAKGRWQLLLSGLVDACVARAIEASSLEFPAGGGFWAPFSQAQSRDIVTALASLGYRFDGLGGFADGRLPSQRDLSLALGYAGLDPMRMRTWPNEKAMGQIFDGVRVAADEYVAAAAGDLTLGEMVALLRGRAEPLADLWNNWGRIRPLLLAV